ncbi:MAG: hypothetical protein LBD50_02485 [Rickettsiales bacterium]|nr:hypothetical protein [Rickettsiales bacterium]
MRKICVFVFALAGLAFAAGDSFAASYTCTQCSATSSWQCPQNMYTNNSYFASQSNCQAAGSCYECPDGGTTTTLSSTCYDNFGGYDKCYKRFVPDPGTGNPSSGIMCYYDGTAYTKDCFGPGIECVNGRYETSAHKCELCSVGTGDPSATSDSSDNPNRIGAGDLRWPITDCFITGSTDETGTYIYGATNKCYYDDGTIPK